MKRILTIALLATLLGSCSHDFTGRWASEIVADDGMAHSSDTLQFFGTDSLTMIETISGEALIPMGKADARIDTTELSAVAELNRLASATGNDSLTLRMTYSITVTTHGSYALRDGNIVITLNPNDLEADFTEMRFPDLSPDVEQLYLEKVGGEDFKSQMALEYLQYQSEELKLSPTLTLAKPSISGNRMTATIDGETVTYKRVK